MLWLLAMACSSEVEVGQADLELRAVVGDDAVGGIVELINGGNGDAHLEFELDPPEWQIMLDPEAVTVPHWQPGCCSHHRILEVFLVTDEPLDYNGRLLILERDELVRELPVDAIVAAE